MCMCVVSSRFYAAEIVCGLASFCTRKGSFTGAGFGGEMGGV